MFFAIIERQALRRGDFASVEELVAAIGRFCDGWNQRCRPFCWTKDAEQLLPTLKRPHRLGLDQPAASAEEKGSQDMDRRQQPGTPLGSWSVELAVCAEMVFLDLPIIERVRRIADLGFQVEIWDWTTKTSTPWPAAARRSRR